MPIVFLSVIVIGVALFAYVLVAVWRSTPDDSYSRFVPRSYRRYRDHAACGACGYPAKGLSTFQCPECGSDLREVGITTPHSLRRVGPVGKVVCWTIGLLIIAWIATEALIQPVLPRVESAEVRWHYMSPSSGAYEGVRLNAEGQRLLWPGQIRDRSTMGEGAFRKLTLRLEHPTSPESVLEIDLVTKRAFARQRHLRGNPTSFDFDQKALLAWMQSEGIDTTSPAVQQEATTLTKAVDRITLGDQQAPPPRPGFGGYGGGGGRGSGRRYDGADPYILGFWFAVWIAMTVLILRHERRGVVPAA